MAIIALAIMLRDYPIRRQGCGLAAGDWHHLCRYQFRGRPKSTAIFTSPDP
ncbi:MAG: hypothetical protein N838_09560 [Thiohalocapsa sp. PB-PSB1]|jgi:hypothetical protein|nr:MAG: hypothetical protein N838_14025 [Thiohalocapsa sp. PB-PSB1]QQO53561.1 MAG: hypothetical protein N838_09560 [Thiohalocapsa sp. PB-PSB1]